MALVCAHEGQTLRKGFFSDALGSATVGVTPAMISYICKSFVKSYSLFISPCNPLMKSSIPPQLRHFFLGSSGVLGLSTFIL